MDQIVAGLVEPVSSSESVTLKGKGYWECSQLQHTKRNDIVELYFPDFESQAWVLCGNWRYHGDVIGCDGMYCPIQIISTGRMT